MDEQEKEGRATEVEKEVNATFSNDTLKNEMDDDLDHDEVTEASHDAIETAENPAPPPYDAPNPVDVYIQVITGWETSSDTTGDVAKSSQRPTFTLIGADGANITGTLDKLPDPGQKGFTKLYGQPNIFPLKTAILQASSTDPWLMLSFSVFSPSNPIHLGGYQEFGCLGSNSNARGMGGFYLQKEPAPSANPNYNKPPYRNAYNYPSYSGQGGHPYGPSITLENSQFKDCRPEGPIESEAFKECRKTMPAWKSGGCVIRTCTDKPAPLCS
jgi:hypothetical protein